jgi:arginyl-tRNA synthetase
MSKRAGEFVTLDDLVAEIGVDAARWFLLSRSHDTTIDLDLDLAVEQSSENPVYYVQYAHARIASMLVKAGAERVAEALASQGMPAGGPDGLVDLPQTLHPRSGPQTRSNTGMPDEVSGGTFLDDPLGNLDRLKGLEGAQPEHPSERGLIKRLLAFPGEVQEAARRRAPHRIAAYALELAQEFTAFYRDCHVLDVQPRELESLRIALCVATQRTIACSLDLLGVSSPAEM